MQVWPNKEGSRFGPWVLLAGMEGGRGTLSCRTRRPSGVGLLCLELFDTDSVTIFRLR